MENGIIDLEAYLAKPSYYRLLSHFYLYDTLYSYNFDRFEEKQLTGPYGKISHYNNVALLKEQGFIKTFDLPGENEYLERFATNEDFIQIIGLLKIIQGEHLDAFSKIVKKGVNQDFPLLERKLVKSGQNILALKERLYSLVYREMYGEVLHPTLSLDCYGALDLSFPKSDIYRVLIGNIPIPDESVPLSDIIQYKDDSRNRLRFLRLQSWVRKLSSQEISGKEISEEVETLIAEYKNEMKLSGMRMKIAKIEFAIKILPHIVEKIAKLSFSELADPIVKLTYEKVNLLQAENKAKGNELSYIIRIDNNKEDY